MAAARFDPATLVVLRPGKRCKLVRGALIGTYGLPGVSSMESGQCRIKGLLLVHKHFRTLEIDGVSRPACLVQRSE